jgi:hypothetical protein
MAPEIRYLGCKLSEKNIMSDGQVRDIFYVTVEFNWNPVKKVQTDLSDVKLELLRELERILVNEFKKSVTIYVISVYIYKVCGVEMNREDQL